MNMALSSFFTLAGGVGLFLHGLTYSTKAFSKILGDRGDTLLGSLLQYRSFSFVTGAFLSTLAQSSTAATSFAVGLVSAGLLPLQSAMATMIGASIGTTFVTLVLALNLVMWAPLGLGICAFLVRSSKRYLQKWGALGLGIFLILTGMLLIQQGIRPLSSSEFLRETILSLGQRPFLIMLLSFGITGILQSSVPVIGLAMALVSSGLLPLEGVYFLVLGSHLGTSIMVLFAGMGEKKHARILAWSSFLYKLAGVTLLFPFHSLVTSWAVHAFSTPEARVFCIQSMVVWTNALLLLPFSDLLSRGGTALVDFFGRPALGEPRYLEKPPPPFERLALSLLAKEMVRLANLMEEVLLRVFEYPQGSERLTLVAQGARELEKNCTDYVLALPLPQKDDQVWSNYMALINELSSMKSLNQTLLRDFLPLCRKWSFVKGRHDLLSYEEWRHLGRLLLELMNKNFGTFALGDPYQRVSFEREYHGFLQKIHAIETALDIREELFNSPGSLLLWELINILKNLGRQSLHFGQSHPEEKNFPEKRESPKDHEIT